MLRTWDVMPFSLADTVPLKENETRHYTH